MRHGFIRLVTFTFFFMALAGCPSPNPPADAADAVADGVIDVARVDSGMDIVAPPTDAGLDGSKDAGPCSLTSCGGECVNTDSDVHHCGDCETDCGSLDHVSGAVRCMAGACVVGSACSDGFANCDGDDSNGCETDLSLASTCGACMTSCAEPTPACTRGPGGAYACTSGCTGATSTRCGTGCVDTQTDVHHCGDCATDCAALDHVSPSVACVSGACVVAGHCANGFGDCDGTVSNGCEVDLTTPAQCGVCGAAACVEPTPFCSMGAGGIYACTSGCGGATATRCAAMCVDTTTNPSFCGACGTSCPSRPNANPTCAASACGFMCDGGFGDCDTIASNGCETPLVTDPAHCGACNNACPVPANGTATCADAVCGVACSTGYHACGANCANNTSTSSCGSSCMPCVAPPNATATCNGTTCGFTCAAGYVDADLDPTNGCEQQITGCRGLNSCLSTCTTSACVTACRSHATSTATSLYDSVVNCSWNVCLWANDAGAGGCSYYGDTSPNCTDCMAQSRLGGAAGPCTTPSPACGSCSSNFDACLADLP